MTRAENPFARGRAWVDSAKIAGIGRHEPTTVYQEEKARHTRIEELAKLFQQANQGGTPVIEGHSDLVTPLRTPAVEGKSPPSREV